MPAEARAGSETPHDVGSTPGRRVAVTPGRRAANVPVDSPSTCLRVEDIQAEAERQAAKAAYVGKRAAAVPVSPEVVAHEADIVGDVNVAMVLAGLEPVDQSTPFDFDETARLRIDREEPEQVVATYITTSSSGEPVPAGKRRAVKPAKHTGNRGPLFKALPSVPVLLGVAALAISIGGVVTVDDATPAAAGSSNGVVRAASALTGSAGSGKVVGGRDQITSRDSDRSAQTDAAGTDALPESVTELAQQREGALAQYANEAEKYAKVLAQDVWVYPLEPVFLTARFGQYGLWSSYHTGLDFNGDTGDQIHAIANGVVTFAGYDGSYGNKTVVTLEDGTELWFCHQTTQYVSVGDKVLRGDIIGTVGSTGHVTGSHLHVEVRPGGGDPVDPYTAMQQHGLFLGSEAQPG